MGLKYNWVFPTYDNEKILTLSKEYNIPETTSKILAARNIDSLKEIREFLASEYEEGYDPYLIYNMDIAVERINLAIENEEKILIYGDYDADGITSTVLMLETLTSLGANVSSYIPNRFTEGYGPNKDAFKNIIESGITLIITVDNGIAAVDEINYANELGCDVIITDHHQIQDTIPEAYAIIHPEHPKGKYPFGKLAGVGVAFKLAHALLDIYPDFFLDLVAIGSVADMVPLVSENRVFVKQGLALLNEDTRLGIKMLLEIAGHYGIIDEQTIGFTIAPRLNAIGRISSAKEGLQFLSTDDNKEAYLLAQKIDNYNIERKNITENIIKTIDNLVLDKEDKSVLVLAGENFHEGVLGIVASNVVEKFKKPSLVMNIENGSVKGSARSILSFNIYEAMNKIKHLFTAFGGHSLAAGFSAKLENLDEIERELCKIFDIYLEESESQKIEKSIDVVTTAENVSYEMLSAIDMLKPFGSNFEKPTILLQNCRVIDKIEFGSDKQYLRLIVGSEHDKLECISFKDNSDYKEINVGDTLDILCNLDRNNFNGRTKIQALLMDVDIKKFLFNDYRDSNIDFNSLPVEQLKLSKYYSDHKNNIYKYSDINQITDSYDTINILDIPQSLEEVNNIINLNPCNIKLYCREKKLLTDEYKISKDRLIKLFNIILKTEKLELNTPNNLKKLVLFLDTNIDSFKIMIQILLELKLITLEKNIVIINKNYTEIKLENSITYSNIIKRFELENLFLKSTITDINEKLGKQ